MLTGAPLPILKGTRVTLRRPIPADIEARHAIGRHAEIIRAYGGTFDPATPYTRQDAEREISFLIAQPHAWAIDVDGFVGHVRFHSVDARDRRAALAVGIQNPALLGQGLGTEALRLALGFGFASGLHRVSVRVLASNARAVGCYRKCGFVVEGRERDGMVKQRLVQRRHHDHRRARPIASAATDSARLSAMPCASLFSELKPYGANSIAPRAGYGRTASSK